ncbi:MAG: hypothetical protein EBQ76_06755 [Betaproteobacteria bacterium]|nr:hypothetical protein [Betaproteobacteria bacterium]
MRVNLCLLAMNLLVLGASLASRGSHQLGGVTAVLSELPWESFGTQIGEMAYADAIDVPALLAGWLGLTGLWATATLFAQMLAQRKSTAPSPSSSHVREERLVERLDEGFDERGPIDGAIAHPEAIEAVPIAPSLPEPKDDFIPGAPPGPIEPGVQSLLDELGSTGNQLGPEARAELRRLHAALEVLASSPSTQKSLQA